jgi:hypothetical protein
MKYVHPVSYMWGVITAKWHNELLELHLHTDLDMPSTERSHFLCEMENPNEKFIQQLTEEQYFIVFNDCPSWDWQIETFFDFCYAGRGIGEDGYPTYPPITEWEYYKKAVELGFIKGE